MHADNSDRQVYDVAKTAAPRRDAANPKTDPPRSNLEKDPDDWVSGDDPMTGAQASYLKTLSEEAQDPGAFDANLTKAEASLRIDALKEKLGRASGGVP
jgi:Protein of unknown function (DUF3072)